MVEIFWTPAKVNKLRKLYPRGKNADLVKAFGATVLAIRTAARKHDIRKEVSSNNPWTPEMIEKLIRWYPNTKNAVIAKRLGMDEKQVQGKAFKLRLLKDPVWKYRCSKKGMFKKGQEPPNKGRKWSEYMSAEGMQRSRETQFKEGNINHNSKYDGAITVRVHKGSGITYKWRRISKSKWVPLHVYNWEQKHGPVPEGYIVVFKDPSKTMDCRPSKLELISRQENMRRNSASLNLSDGYVANCLAWRNKEAAKAVLQHSDLIELKRTSLILNRTIHETTTLR